MRAWPSPTSLRKGSAVRSMIQNEFLGVDQRPEQIAKAFASRCGLRQVPFGPLDLRRLRRAAERSQPGDADQVLPVRRPARLLGTGDLLNPAALVQVLLNERVVVQKDRLQQARLVVALTVAIDGAIRFAKH